MKKTKDIALIGVYTALLIGGQLALFAISGIEVVTVLLLSFAYYYGVKRSMIVVIAFSILRCFLFGFFPNVIILYLIYYPLFVIIFGAIGNGFKRAVNPARHVIVVAIAVLCTLLLTALDDVITPLYYGMDNVQIKAYAIASLYTVMPQVLCTIITVSTFFRPLLKIFKVVYK